MPAMWWLEAERKRLARKGDVEGAAIIAMEQLEIAEKVGFTPPEDAQCPTCGADIGCQAEESDEVGEGESENDSDRERRKAALKALQSTIFN